MKGSQPQHESEVAGNRQHADLNEYGNVGFADLVLVLRDRDARSSDYAVPAAAGASASGVAAPTSASRTIASTWLL